MKKSLFPLAAVILAVAASAFSPKAKQATQAYFWYDAETLLPLNGGTPTATTPPQCQGGATDCAYGFTDEQSDPDPDNAQIVARKQ